MSLFSDTLRSALDDIDVGYTNDQITQCEAYYRLVAETNRHTNLTRITDEADAAQRHFAEAAALLSYAALPDGARVIDIGTGGGFPGMPLKILRPDINMTLLDASGKKTDFIHSAAETLGAHVTVLCARAEDAAKTDLREHFDAAVSRAVAALNVLTELAAPFVRTLGIFAAWKGETYAQELSDAKNALSQLSCKVTGVHPLGQGALIIAEKQKPAPIEYPRRFAKIKSHPL
jgi:16S rRNA (guanine527-N7)-methyltransferase